MNTNSLKIAKIIKDAEDSVKSLLEKFFRIVDINTDEVNIILRAHLFLEYQIDEIICASMNRGDLLLEFSFHQKIMILRALESLKIEDLDSLLNLNKVRNRCSHSLEYKVTIADIESIGRPFGENYQKIKEENEGTKILLIRVLTQLLFTNLFTKHFHMTKIDKVIPKAK